MKKVFIVPFMLAGICLTSCGNNYSYTNLKFAINEIWAYTNSGALPLNPTLKKFNVKGTFVLKGDYDGNQDIGIFDIIHSFDYEQKYFCKSEKMEFRDHISENYSLVDYTYYDWKNNLYVKGSEDIEYGTSEEYEVYLPYEDGEYYSDSYVLNEVAGLYFSLFKECFVDVIFYPFSYIDLNNLYDESGISIRSLTESNLDLEIDLSKYVACIAPFCEDMGYSRLGANGTIKIGFENKILKYYRINIDAIYETTNSYGEAEVEELSYKGDLVFDYGQCDYSYRK